MENTFTLLMSLILFHLSNSTAQPWRRDCAVKHETWEQMKRLLGKLVLYPSAFRVKRGTPALLNPSIQRSVEDANLLYEAVWSGLYVEEEKMVLRVFDEELASLRRLQPLQVMCEDVLPRTLSDILRLCYYLEKHRARMNKEDFERTVFTLVYTAQRLAQGFVGQQKELWAYALLQLFKGIKKDLGAK